MPGWTVIQLPAARLAAEPDAGCQGQAGWMDIDLAVGPDASWLDIDLAAGPDRAGCRLAGWPPGQLLGGMRGQMPA